VPKLSHSSPSLLVEAVESRSHWVVSNGKPQTLANLAWHAGPRWGMPIQQHQQQIDHHRSCWTPSWIVPIGSLPKVTVQRSRLWPGRVQPSDNMENRHRYLQAIEERAGWFVAHDGPVAMNHHNYLEHRFHWFVTNGTPQEIPGRVPNCPTHRHYCLVPLNIALIGSYRMVPHMMQSRTWQASVPL
jgi:hypothetical protein